MILTIIQFSKRPYIISEILLGLYLVIFTVLFGPVFSPIAKLLGYAAVGFFFLELFWRGKVDDFLITIRPMWPYLFFYIILPIAVYPLLPYMGAIINNITNCVAFSIVFFMVRKYKVLHNIDFSYLCIAIGIGSMYFIFPSLLGIDAASQTRIKMKSAFLGTEDSGLNASNISLYCGLASLIAVRCLSTTGRGIRQFFGLTARYWKSWASLACLVASFVIIIKVSGSRQGLIWLMFIVALICAIRFQKNIFLGFIGTAFFGLFLVGVVFFVFHDTELVRRILIVFDQRMMAVDPEQSVLDRWDMYKVGFDMWLDSPIWGNGNEAFRALSVYAGHYSHSNYIEILANYGALGFLFFYVPIVLVVSRSISMFFKAPVAYRTLLLWVLISFVAILVSGFFIPTFYRKPMVVLLAYLFATFYNIREDVSRGGQSGQMTTNRRRW